MFPVRTLGIGHHQGITVSATPQWPRHKTTAVTRKISGSQTG